MPLPRHYVAQVHWRSVLSWRDQPDSHGDDGEVVGTFVYGTSQPILARIVPDDVLWLVTFPRYGTAVQPPSVLARLTVRAPRLDDTVPEVSRYPHVVFGTPDSPYFPINNALGALRRTGLLPPLAPDGTTTCAHCRKLHTPERGTYSGLPNHLLSVRELSADGAATLDRFAHAVAAGHRVFLSYRHDDDPLAPMIGQALDDLGVSAWWDRWMIDRNTGTDQIDEALLREVLDDGVRQACWCVVLVGRTWRQSVWTAYELQRAREELTRKRRHPMEILPVWRCAEARVWGPRGTRPPLDLVGEDDHRLIAERILEAVGLEAAGVQARPGGSAGASWSGSRPGAR